MVIQKGSEPRTLRMCFVLLHKNTEEKYRLAEVGGSIFGGVRMFFRVFRHDVET